MVIDRNIEQGREGGRAGGVEATQQGGFATALRADGDEEGGREGGVEDVGGEGGEEEVVGGCCCCCCCC